MDEEILETMKLFSKERVERLPENARNLFYAMMKIADERDYYKNIIEELKKSLKSDINIYSCRCDKKYSEAYLNGARFGRSTVLFELEELEKRE